MSRYRRDASDLTKRNMTRAYNINNNFQFNNPVGESQNDILSSYQGRLTPGQISQIKTSFGFSRNLPCESLCPIEEEETFNSQSTTTIFGSYEFSNEQPAQINIENEISKPNSSLAPGTGNFTIEWFSKFTPNSRGSKNTIFSIGSDESFNKKIMSLVIELSGSYISTDISNTYNVMFYFYDIIFGSQSVFFGTFSPSNHYFTTELLKNWNHMALVGTNNTLTNFSTFQFFVNGFAFSPIIIQNFSSFYTNPDNSFIRGPQNYNILIPSSIAYPYLTLGNQNSQLIGSEPIINRTNFEFNGCITNFRWTTDIPISSDGALYRNFFKIPSTPLLPIMFQSNNSSLTSLTKLLLDGNILYNTIYDISPYSRKVSTFNKVGNLYIKLSKEQPNQSSLTLPQPKYGSFYFNKFYRINSEYYNGINGNIPLTPMFIDISNSPALQIGSRPFTFEWWQWIDLYTLNTGTRPPPQQINVFSYSNQFDQNTNISPAFIINFLNDTSNNGVALGVTLNPGLTTQNQVYFGSFGNSVVNATQLYDISDLNNKWVHFAFQGDGRGNLNMYFNGEPFGTQRLVNYNFTNPNINSSLRIGDWAYNNITPPQQSWSTFSGYLTGIRLNIKTMKYNRGFVPSLLPLSKDISSVLILNNTLSENTTQNIYKDTSNFNLSITNPNTAVMLHPFIPTSTRAGPPTELKVSFVNNQIFLFFSPGKNGGSFITNYSYSTDGGTTFKNFNPRQIGTSVLITKESSSNNDISNMKTYTIFLRAINELGYGVPNELGLDVSAVQSRFAVFFTSGTYNWTAPSDVSNVEYLIVGGGGGSATGDNYRAGGGGGGGQVNHGFTSVVPNRTYTIRVGAGGLGSLPGYGNNGFSGEDSSFNLIISKGGGGGFGPPNFNSSKKNGGGGNASTSTSASEGGGSGIFLGTGTGGAGGGGGSLYSGNDVFGEIGGYGGEGQYNSITGQELEYGKGGYGADYGRENGPLDENYLGYGGNGGASLQPYRGGRGGDGCVILRYH